MITVSASLNLQLKPMLALYVWEQIRSDLETTDQSRVGMVKQHRKGGGRPAGFSVPTLVLAEAADCWCSIVLKTRVTVSTSELSLTAYIA